MPVVWTLRYSREDVTSGVFAEHLRILGADIGVHSVWGTAVESIPIIEVEFFGPAGVLHCDPGQFGSILSRRTSVQHRDEEPRLRYTLHDAVLRLEHGHIWFSKPDVNQIAEEMTNVIRAQTEPPDEDFRVRLEQARLDSPPPVPMEIGRGIDWGSISLQPEGDGDPDLDIAAEYEALDSRPRYTYPHPSMHDELGLIRPGSLTYVMGATGSGKTTFALTLALRQFIHIGATVIFYTDEVSESSIIDCAARLISDDLTYGRAYLRGSDRFFVCSRGNDNLSSILVPDAPTIVCYDTFPSRPSPSDVNHLVNMYRLVSESPFRAPMVVTGVPARDRETYASIHPTIRGLTDTVMDVSLRVALGTSDFRPLDIHVSRSRSGVRTYYGVMASAAPFLRVPSNEPEPEPTTIWERILTS